jgi:hypothetical protein
MEPGGSLPHSQDPANSPYPKPDKFSPCPHPTYWKRITRVSFHLHLGLPNGLLPSGFPTKTPYAPLLYPHKCHVSRPSHYSRYDHPNNIRWIQIIKLLITQSLHSPVTSSLLDALGLYGQKLNPSQHVWREHQYQILSRLIQWFRIYNTTYRPIHVTSSSYVHFIDFLQQTHKKWRRTCCPYQSLLRYSSF